MFLNNFKYSIKILFKNKSLIFWTYGFPIIMATFFFLAFSNIENKEKLDVINIGIVSNEEFNNNKIVKDVFEKLSKDGNDKLFNIKYVSVNDANDLLDNKEIIGYLHIDNNKKNIVIKENGINETVFKSVVDEISEKEKLIINLSSKKINNEMNKGNNINYELIYQEIVSEINKKNVNIKHNSKDNLSYTVIEFYTLIAMTCLYSGTMGMYVINNTLANMSSRGKRVAISAISKAKLLLSGILASFVAQLIGLILLFAFTIGILGVDYGNNFLYISILSVIGTIAGLSFGVMVASVFKVNENTKIGIIISLTMLFSFLSGMMGITMKYIIDKNVPIINMFNPANMITDGLYSLYYYDTFSRFNMNVISLIIFSLIMIVISFIYLRRQKYASI